MKFLLSVVLGMVPFVARGGVVISEVLFNEIGADVSGEWIEISNNGTESVDLTGWRIGDEETRGATSLTEAMMVFPAESTIGPGEVKIVALNANLFLAQYGFLPDFECAAGTAEDHAEVPNLTTDSAWDPDGGVINMSNSNDHVLLLDATEGVMDRVNWGNSGGLSPGLNPDAEADGQSWQRIDPRGDTNLATDWALVPIERRSTPGVIPGPLQFQAEISESPGGPILKWPAWPGAISYRVQMSETMEEWSDEALQLTTTEWLLPAVLPAKVFFRVLAD